MTSVLKEGKSRHRNRHTQREGDVKMEDNHVQAKEKGLEQILPQQNQPCQHFPQTEPTLSTL